MRAPQARQRPRRHRYETTGTLSRTASVVPQDMQAEAGRTIERRRGTRAATTFRKLPRARPGKKATRASAIALYPENCCGGLGWAYTSGLPGIPAGATTGAKACVVSLLARMIWLPIIGPSEKALFPYSRFPLAEKGPWN